MKITSWNINGLRAIIKKNFKEDIQKLNPDILCLQETKADVPTAKALLETLDFKYIYASSAEKKGYSGTALLSQREPLEIFYGMGNEKHDKEGRIITAGFENFFLVTVYVPNSGQKLKRLDYREEWNRDFKDFLLKLEKQKPVIACGDFNVAHQPIDLKNPKSNYNKTAGYTQLEIDAMTDLLNSGFVDAYRYLYPERIQYTFWNYRFNARARNAGWRIDYFVVSKKLTDKIKDVIIHDDIYGSDHCPVSLILDDF